MSDETEARFVELAELGPNWDSYGAEPIDPACIDGAREVLASLEQEVFICPTVNGGVDLEWNSEHVSIELEPGDKVSFHVGDSYTVPEAELDAANGELKRLRAQWAAVLALHASDLNVDTYLVECTECIELWPCPTARALGVTE